MILQKEIEVIPTGKIKYYYEELGYELHGKTPIFVKNEHLSDTSKVMEQRKCDSEECENIFFRPHKDMVKNFNKYGKDLCPECVEKERVKRIRETSLERYGVKNPMMAKEIQEKAKKTTLEHFGVEYPTQNKQVIELRTSNFLEKYGVENPQQIESIKNKAKQTNLKKYGSENPFGSKEIQEKIRQTNLEKYGTEYATQSEEVKSKTEETCLERYGYSYTSQVPEIKEKIKESFIKNYGVDNSFDIPGMRERIKQTMIERYGVENPMFNEEIKEKLRQTLTQNGSVPTSKPQAKLYELCKNWFPQYNVLLNYPLSSLSLDIVLKLENNLKIDIEYDGWFWHKDSGKKDFSRDWFVQSQGYKVIRIKSNTLLPTKEQLEECIDYVSQENHNFSRIFLQDWKDLENKNNTLKTETKQ